MYFFIDGGGHTSEDPFRDALLRGEMGLLVASLVRSIRSFPLELQRAGADVMDWIASRFVGKAAIIRVRPSPSFQPRFLLTSCRKPRDAGL